MNEVPAYRVVAAEKLSGGVVVTFEDGMSAVYSASLLRAALTHAEALCGSTMPEAERTDREQLPPASARPLLPFRKS